MNEMFNKSESHNLEHQEAQLRVQLQTEEVMMTSLKESFQENSESERQAVISAQQSASSLQSEMSQATTACDSKETEVTRFTQGRRTPRMTHLFIYHHQE